MEDNKHLREQFHNWKHNPITKRLFDLLKEDRAQLAEGLIYGSFEDDEEVKGRCRAIDNLLKVTIEDLFSEVMYEQSIGD